MGAGAGVGVDVLKQDYDSSNMGGGLILFSCSIVLFQLRVHGGNKGKRKMKNGRERFRYGASSVFSQGVSGIRERTCLQSYYV